METLGYFLLPAATVIGLLVACWAPFWIYGWGYWSGYRDGERTIGRWEEGKRHGWNTAMVVMNKAEYRLDPASGKVRLVWTDTGTPL